MTSITQPVSPAARARFRQILAAHPGLTLDELTERLERAHDRLSAPLVLGYLHRCREVRKDDDGRIWPV
ncbi:hypothetical protein ACIRPU_02115 [Streptomyces sp. NPDC102259]|uniref:hypothetical protein n=1 Tax=Streptomyces sp. NPDC102259 TaxID=3366148 RepID=UPI0037F811A9